MTTLRIHTGIFSDPGVASADFRGERFIGAKQGDHHSTVAEIDDPSAELVQAFLEFAPQLNAHSVKQVDGLWTGFRFGVWDKQAPV